MPSYGYEFYILLFNSTSHSFAALTREISRSTLEDKIHIHAQSCNMLYWGFSHDVTKIQTTKQLILLRF